MQNKISFSFGQNWSDYVKTIDQYSIDSAKQNLLKWLGEDEIKGKKILDIGCGSGVHSLCFHQLGAAELISLDYDVKSVDATNYLRTKNNSPKNWTVLQGSVLDKEFIQSLGSFDIVYSWGVLHHTGDMWTAIENSLIPISAHGKYWIAIYQKGLRYPRDLALKQRYNNVGRLGKKIMIRKEIMKVMMKRYKNGRNPFAWNERVSRGMDTYHDIVDWLGGLPYEVANKDEIISFCAEKANLELIKIHEGVETSNSIYLFKR